MKVLIVGGGPAGMIAAISAAKENNEVVIIEKNNELGKKILVTGKGRCNITSSVDISEFTNYIPGNGKFLYSAFQNFTNRDIIDLLEKNGLKVKEERGNRIFPTTDRAEDVRHILEQEVYKNGIKVKLNSKVKDLIIEDNVIKGIVFENGEKLLADKVIIATGGKSYPGTGSTGDGYVMAEKAGHTINKVRGSLVPLVSNDKACQELQGLSLKNVGIQLVDLTNNKKIYDDFGEMLFTHFGVSGPTILSSSAHLLRYNNVEELLKQNKIKLYIDLKPALTIEKLNERVLRDFDEFKNKEFKNSLDKLLPKKLIPVVIKKANIDEYKKVNEISKEERLRLVNVLKKFEITINGFRPVEEAIVTAGGVPTKEINPKTMESKIVKGLFFAGEVIDVDAYTGGFNLQIAYSTGYTAGMQDI